MAVEMRPDAHCRFALFVPRCWNEFDEVRAFCDVSLYWGYTAYDIHSTVVLQSRSRFGGVPVLSGCHFSGIHTKNGQTV